MSFVKRLLLGIDEAGRGPLAGPVAVGVVCVSHDFDFRLIKNIRDSKQLSDFGRELWFERLRILERDAGLTYKVMFSSATVIDQCGITSAVRSALHRGVRTLAPDPRGVEILLDGLLTAPKEYAQKTIIGGDESEPLIALASIAAKVKRDRLMRRLALRYPEYDFDIHKGYGTKRHHEALRKYGPSDIHRKTWIKV